MAFRSASTGTVTGKTVTISAPSGIAQSDQLIAFLVSGDDAATYAAPSGWSSLGVYMNPGSGGSNVPTQAFQKIAGASEPGSYNFVSTNSQPLAGVIVDYSGVQVDVQNTKTSGSGTSSSQVGASLNTSQGSELVVAFWGQALGAGAGITLPGGLTARASVVGYGAKNVSLAVGDYTGPGTAGNTSPGTATGDNTWWAQITVALASPAPAAPSLLFPGNASYSDVQSNGGPFGWQYNPNGSPGGQTGYDFRRKISGGSYSYWNAGSSSFQGTDITNASTSQQITFAVSVWSDGHVYNWSAKTQDSGGLGPYAADFVLNSQVAPSVTVSAPTGTYSANQTPTVTWSDSLASGGSQTSYRVVTYSAAQYGAGGFTPGSGPSLDDSGVVASSSTSYTVQNQILSGTTCRSYVQIVQTPGGQTSAWAFSSFTVTVDTPATPSITAVAGNDPSTGCPRVTLTVQCQDNFLTANQSCLTNGNTTGWTATAGTISAVTSPAPPSGVSSNYVMQIAGSGTDSQTTPTGTSGIPVLGSTQYTVLASFRSASTARSCNVAVAWYTSAGSLISTSTSGNITDSSSAWTQALLTVTSPVTAAFAAVITTELSTGAENHYVTEISLAPGTVSAWTIGGFVGSTSVTILRSDGVYVRLASPANPAVVPTPSQTVVVYDYEATPTTIYTYTAQVIVPSVGASGLVVSSNVDIPGGQGYWELDPTNYPSAINSNPTAWNPSQTEQSAAHTVLNQTTQNVVASAMQAPDFAGTFETFSAAIYQGIVALATSQKTIFISSPFGYSYYFRLALAPGGMSSGSGSTAHSSQQLASTAAAPHNTVALTGIAQPRPIV